MENRYIYSGTKKLRCGYTTGSCAAGAAKAAALMLLSGKIIENVVITIPSGEKITLAVTSQNISDNSAVCAVIKDGGDDPDVTKGMEIFAEVTRSADRIEITGGKGIGTVTKVGLDQPVGAAAINSVPRKMIAASVSEAAALSGYTGGFRIVISAPRGEMIAKKTFNPRMGIVGGISIIGTTGIVEPMSNSAIIETIRAESRMHRVAGQKYLLLTVGNYSEDFIRLRAGDLSGRAVTCSNFIGEAIDIGVSLGFSGILLVGHMGKLVKLGSGIMNTHSSYADGRMETLIACGAIAGVERSILSQLTDCATSDAALDILYDNNAAEQTLEVLAGRIDHYLNARAKNETEIGAVIFSNRHDLVLKTRSADDIIKHITTSEQKRF